MKFNVGLLLGTAAVAAAASIPNIPAPDTNGTALIKREQSSPGCTVGDGGTKFEWASCEHTEHQSIDAKVRKIKDGRIVDKPWSDGDLWCWIVWEGSGSDRVPCDGDGNPYALTDKASCMTVSTNVLGEYERYHHGGCFT
ncbi:hypothetical protein NUU61_000527 [Penicillium alfredii]|uniref:Uncharacterized protein n=1 Tax=Penicillium alfredii TaxID=1506179 RepID=A0A9W9GA98_9EURO|nr:uncharacterized protein NUU61_000527 [Penicillium alfredii]KAJ5114768.1 hypothetical protein NUU61_000527 [Penicillium alfredii]